MEKDLNKLIKYILNSGQEETDSVISTVKSVKKLAKKIKKAKNA